MKRTLLPLLFGLLVSLAHYTAWGQNKSLYFDSTKNCLRGIVFLLKDSVTNKRDTVFRDIKYETKIKTERDKNKWITKTSFNAVLREDFPQEILTKIDSVYFIERCTIKTFTIYFTSKGSDKNIELTPPYLNTKAKEMLRECAKPSAKTKVQFEFIVVNEKKQEEHLNIIIKK